MRIVVDASVAVKWFIPEVHSEAAKRVLEADHELIAPELILAEVASALWKKRRRGELPADAARDMFADFRRYPIRMVRLTPLSEAAYRIAERLERSVYDCFYLALAEHSDGSLLTADRRFYEAAAADSTTPSPLWIEHLA